jgi:hypothetical protein
MNSMIRKLTLCVLLGASISAHAAFVPFPDGEFNAGQGTWGQVGPAAFTYPATGGSSGGANGGYGAINANGSWGIWVNNNDNGSFIPLASLGLVAGNGYTFKMDMKIQPGSNTNILGDLKLEWQGAGNTGDMPATYVDGNWNTHLFPVIIPAGVTGMKVVPVCNDSNFVGFDNIGFESVPYYLAPPPPSDVIVQEFFPAASPRWGAPVLVGNAITGTSTWSNTEGNPAGSTILAAANPNGGGANASFTYTATGVNFGTGPVVISFDGKLLDGLPGTAIHVRYNGNFVGAIQGSFNQSTYSTYTQTFNLNQGFTATTTFNLTFEIALGNGAGSSGTIAIDNIIVKTNLPPTTFSAAIKTGKAVSWTPPNGTDAYQPQKSTNNVAFTDVGPLILGNTQNAIFDSPGAPFYRVLQSVPFTQDIVFNGGFETATGFPDEADGWGSPVGQDAYRILTGAHTGNACMQLKAVNVLDEANASETNQNTLNAGGPAITTGATYTLKFWSKQISSGPSYVQEYRVSWLAAGGGEVLPGAWQTLPVGTTGLWTERTLTGLVAPAGAVTALIQIAGKTGAVTGGFGEVHIDDVSLVATGYNPPTVLAATAVSSVEVSWASALAKNYQVQTSGDLATWADFGGVIAGNGSTLKVYDPMVDPKKFYKVVRLP